MLFSWLNFQLYLCNWSADYLFSVQNINSAKLFIRYLLGETDGKGEGILPFTTLGTWSAREDVADGDIVPLSQLDVKYLNKKFIYENRQNIIEFWETILKENVTQ